MKKPVDDDLANGVDPPAGAMPSSGGTGDAAAPNWAGCAIPDWLLYDLVHDVWVHLDGDVATIGMTDVAQTRCGRLVQLSWKREGALARRGRPLTVIESAKWVGPFVSPLTGEVLANNRSAFERMSRWQTGTLTEKVGSTRSGRPRWSRSAAG